MPETRPVESEMPSDLTGIREMRRNWRRAHAMATRAAVMMMAVADACHVSYPCVLGNEAERLRYYTTEVRG